MKREFGINSIDLKEDLKVFPHGISIPEISSVFNQIRNFKGNKYPNLEVALSEAQKIDADCEKTPPVIAARMLEFFNQIRNFKGNKYSTKLFFKSKIDELAAIIIQKADVFQNLNASVSVADRKLL